MAKWIVYTRLGGRQRGFRNGRNGLPGAAAGGASFGQRARRSRPGAARVGRESAVRRRSRERLRAERRGYGGAPGGSSPPFSLERRTVSRGGPAAGAGVDRG